MIHVVNKNLLIFHQSCEKKFLLNFEMNRIVLFGLEMEVLLYKTHNNMFFLTGHMSPQALKIKFLFKFGIEVCHNTLEVSNCAVSEIDSRALDPTN